jgi:hypothetical protein
MEYTVYEAGRGPKIYTRRPKSQMKKYLQIMSPLGRTSAGTVSGFHQHVIASDEN